MKKITSAVLFTVLCSAPLMAHEGHDHSFITEPAAVKVGKEFTSELTKKDGGFGFGKLSKSWSEVPAQNAKLLKNGDGFYIVTITNDKEQKMLYVLMSSKGEIYDANFSGKFEKLKE
jgi:hypothetical protein